MRCVRLRFAVAAALLGIVLVLGSCELFGGGAGFLGDSFTLEGQICVPDKEGPPVAVTWGGDLTFKMMYPAVDLAATAVTGGAFSVEVGTPNPGDLALWVNMLPDVTPTPLTISDGTAKGCTINQIVLNVTTGGTFFGPVTRSNEAQTIQVYWTYTDKDVKVTGTGTYTGPGGTGSDVVNMDLDLKAGWNRIIMTRTGTTSYTDTWTVGDEPAGVYWLYFS
jgi:hypothetical protein